MNFESVTYFAHTWGLVYLFVLFAVVVAYALWPRNRSKFRDAANIPFKED